MSTHHYLKTIQPFYNEAESGNKPFEVRFNDRDYQVGDILHLQEFIPPDTFTGKEIEKRATYILDNPQFCKEGYIIIGIEDTKIPVFADTSLPPWERIKILEKAFANKCRKIEALKEKQMPHQLTLDELGQMDDGYVWIEDWSEDLPFKAWGEKRGNKMTALIWVDRAGYGTVAKDIGDKYDQKWYGKEWAAYDRPPGGDK